MNIAIFSDLHGRLLLAFQLCARWQRETGETIDLILQAGDLGAFSAVERLDKATRKYAEYDPTELGFLEHFYRYDADVAELLSKTTCPMIFVRGNHEDHIWLNQQEQQSIESIFPIDAYKRVYNLKTGLPWTFQKGNEQITILGVGRIAAPAGEVNKQQDKYIQDYEVKRLQQLGQQSLDILLTHDARHDFVLMERGVKSKGSTGMKEIADLLGKHQPAYHFFGHYGGPPQVRPDPNGITQSVKLADLHWQHGTSVLESGSMGLLRWQDREQHSFTVLDDPWLKEYNIHTWRYL
jgi:Icc-related predicted phosphoesterase